MKHDLEDFWSLENENSSVFSSMGQFLIEAKKTFQEGYLGFVCFDKIRMD